MSLFPPSASSSAQFNLNLGDYTHHELEELLELPPNYTSEMVVQQTEKIKGRIASEMSVPAQTRDNTIGFIVAVGQSLQGRLDQLKSNVRPPFKKGVDALAQTYQNVYNMDRTLNASSTIPAGGTYIIQQPTTPFSQSFPSEFYPGALNPLMKRTLRQNMNIDTRFRDNYYATLSSNFHLDLPIKLTNVVSMQLSGLELPTSFYVVSKVFGNHCFGIQLTGGDQPMAMVLIPDGNYTFESIQDYLNNYMTSYLGNNYSDIQFISDMNTPCGVGSGGSGRMVVGSKSGNTQFSLHFAITEQGVADVQTPLPLKFGWLLGFRDGTYEGGYQYVSEGLIDLNGARYIYLVVDDYNTSVNDGFYGVFTSSTLNKNILARITLQGSVFSVQSQNNLALVSTPRQYFGPVDVQKLQIQLLDEYGRILNLNNMDWSFCLTFQTIYNL